MSIDVKTKPSNFKGYLLVRDKNGKPKFDDIFKIADNFWDVLTDKERLVIKEERLNYNNPIKE